MTDPLDLAVVAFSPALAKVGVFVVLVAVATGVGLVVAALLEQWERRLK